MDAITLALAKKCINDALKNGSSSEPAVSFGYAQEGVKLPIPEGCTVYTTKGAGSVMFCEYFDDWIAQNNNNPTKIYYSTESVWNQDGDFKWQELDLPEGYSIANVYNNNNNYVIANLSKGTVLVSTLNKSYDFNYGVEIFNFTQWEEFSLPEGSRWACMYSTGGGFYVVAEGTDNHATSSDGRNWRSVTGFGADTHMGREEFRPTVAAGGVVLSTDNGGYGMVYFVPPGWTDGEWTEIEMPGDHMPGMAWSSVVCGDGKFVATSDTEVPYFSEDGFTWQATNGIGAGGSIIYKNGQFIGTNGQNIAYLEDGVNWRTEPCEYYNITSSSRATLLNKRDLSMAIYNGGVIPLVEEVPAISQDGQNITEDFADLVLSTATMGDIKGLTDVLNDITTRLAALENE